MFSIPQTEGIPLTLFLSVVGQLKFRGTSVLLRLPKSPVRRLTRIPSPEQQTPAQWKQPPRKGKTPSPQLPAIKEPSSTAAEEESMETSAQTRAASLQEPDSSLPMVAIYNASGESIDDGEGFCEDEYTIATHLVKVRRSGTLSDVSTLWDLVGTEAVSGSLDSILDTKPGFDRLPSINAFDRVSQNCAQFLLRYDNACSHQEGHVHVRTHVHDVCISVYLFIFLCNNRLPILHSLPPAIQVQRDAIGFALL